MKGSEAVADHFGIDHGTVRKWAAVYREHGPDGLRRRYQRYSASFKASVLRRMAKEGWSVRQTCAMFNIRSPTTLDKWQRAFAQGGIAGLEPKRRRRHRPMAKRNSTSPPLPQRRKAARNMTPEEMSEELEYLRAENDYLKKLKALAQEKRSAEKKKRG